MRATAILTASMLALAAAGCGSRTHESEARVGQRSFQVGEFRSVSLGGSHRVIVTVGGAPSVRAEGDARDLERLEILVENGSLQIRNRENGWSFGFHRDRPPVTVHVTVPSLEAAAIGGSGEMTIDRIEGQRFAASIGGSGDMHIRQLRAEQADFSVGGSGGIRAAGAVRQSRIDLAGSGDIELGGLEIRNATVSVAGSGDVVAKAIETAQVSLVGSGDVTVTGPARCSVTRHGSGDVRCNAPAG